MKSWTWIVEAQSVLQMAVPNRSSQVPDPFDRLNFKLPRLPESLVTEHPELVAWQEELEKWFADVRLTIENNQKLLLAKINKNSQ
jgi:hypothetical protein